MNKQTPAVLLTSIKCIIEHYDKEWLHVHKLKVPLQLFQKISPAI